MNRQGAVYALSLADRNFRYVGISVQPKVRFRQHLNFSRSNSPYPVYRWIRKHGTDTIRMTILNYALIDDLPAAERWWIAELRTLGYTLLNATDGGEGTFNYKHTPETLIKLSMPKSAETREKLCISALTRPPMTQETRAKISAANKGRVPHNLGKSSSEETRAKISAIHKGREKSPEEIEKTRAAHLGSKRSDTTRKRISIAMSGRKWSEERREAAKVRAATAEGRAHLSKAGSSPKPPRSCEAIESTAAKHRGTKRTEEQKARMSEAARNRRSREWTDEQRQKRADQTRYTHTGRKRSDETRAKISTAMKDKPRTEAQIEGRRKAATTLRSRSLTEEHKLKIRTAHRARAARLLAEKQQKQVNV